MIKSRINNVTGSICNESGSYYCTDHCYVEVYVHEGESFPKCERAGRKQNTTWIPVN